MIIAMISRGFTPYFWEHYRSIRHTSKLSFGKLIIGDQSNHVGDLIPLNTGLTSSFERKKFLIDLKSTLALWAKGTAYSIKRVAIAAMKIISLLPI
jgi:hypothetical protein